MKSVSRQITIGQPIATTSATAIKGHRHRGGNRQPRSRPDASTTPSMAAIQIRMNVLWYRPIVTPVSDGSDVGEHQHDGRRRAGRDEGADESQCQSGWDQTGQGAVIPCAEPRLQSHGRQ